MNLIVKCYHISKMILYYILKTSFLKNSTYFFTQNHYRKKSVFHMNIELFGCSVGSSVMTVLYGRAGS